MNSYQTPPASASYPEDNDHFIEQEVFEDLARSQHTFWCEDPVVVANMKALADRSNVGMKTYGRTMAANPLSASEWIDHAIEEALDFANYLRRLKIELGHQGSVPANV